MEGSTILKMNANYLLFRKSTFYMAIKYSQIDFVNDKLMGNSSVFSFKDFTTTSSKNLRYIYFSRLDKTYVLIVDEIKAVCNEKSVHKVQKVIPKLLEAYSNSFIIIDNTHFYIVDLDELSITD